MGKFCEFLREHSIKIINSKKKKMRLLTKTQLNHKSVLFPKKKKKMNMNFWKKKYCKVGDHCHFTGAYRAAVHSICNLKWVDFTAT